MDEEIKAWIRDHKSAPEAISYLKVSRGVWVERLLEIETPQKGECEMMLWEKLLHKMMEGD